MTVGRARRVSCVALSLASWTLVLCVVDVGVCECAVLYILCSPRSGSGSVSVLRVLCTYVPTRDSVLILFLWPALGVENAFAYGRFSLFCSS